MRRLLAIVLQIALVAGCGNSWIGRDQRGPRAAASSKPRASSDIGRDRLTLPNAERSIKFAIIGDSGRGSKEQHEVAAQMVAYRQRFDYKFVLMAGDNIYEGPATEDDYRLKFEEPYKPLLDAGVKFYAALGNHDDTNQVYYKPFNMDGHRYYTFVPPVDPITRWDTRVRFFALDSTYLDLRADADGSSAKSTESRAEWKIAFLHHPLYTSGRYTLAARGIRFALESAFVNGGVDVVFSGHEHIYERAELQQRHPVLHHRRRRLAARRRRHASRPRSRAATTRTITSCWRRSPTKGSSSRRSTGPASRSMRDRCGGLLRTRRPVGDLLRPCALNTRTHSAIGVACRPIMPVG